MGVDSPKRAQKQQGILIAGLAIFFHLHMKEIPMFLMNLLQMDQAYAGLFSAMMWLIQKDALRRVLGADGVALGKTVARAVTKSTVASVA